MNKKTTKQLKEICDLNAEQNIIGAIINGDCDIQKISPSDFTDAIFKEIARISIDLFNKGINVNEKSIDIYMLNNSVYKGYWNTHGVTIIENAKYLYNNDYEYYLEVLKKYTLLRAYTKNGIDISEFCDPDEIDPSVIRNQNEKLYNITLLELKEHFENLVFNINKDIQGSKFDPFSGPIPSKLPGINNKMEWLIEGLFYTNTFQIISAKAKGGKSQLAYQMATCLNNGIDFLGHKVKQSHCAYIDCELSSSEIYIRTEGCREFLKIDENNYKEFNIISLKRTPFDFDEVINGVKKFLKNNPEVDVIFFDNFYSFFDGNINDSSEVRKVLNKLANVSETATIFLICHNNKVTGQSGGTDNAIYAASGSNAFAGYADEFVSIEEKDGGKAKVIHVDGRHISHQSIPCWYNSSTNYFFDTVENEQQARLLIEEDSGNKILGKPEEYLKENYPELYEYISNEDNVRTTKRIVKEFPGETKESLRDKGFWFSNKNKNKNGTGIKTENWYIRDTRI